MIFHRRRSFALAPHGALLLAAALLVSMHPSLCRAAATGPFGAGLPDGGIPGGGFFPRLAGAFISMQFYFNQHMTAAVRAIRHDGSAAWTLLALSFAYGIVHAAGPGHGKAVVSSGSRESMEVDVTKLHAAGLWATMQQDH